MQQAIDEANQALKLAREHAVAWREADIWCFLGRAYHMQGKSEKAEKAFRQLVEAGRGNIYDPRAESKASAADRKI